MAYLWYPNKKKIFINLAPMGLTVLLGAFIILVVRNYHNIIYKLTLRLGLWVAVLREILNKKLGYGLGTFSALSQNIYTKLGHREWIYNEYLAIAFYVGIPALILMLIFLKNKFEDVGTGLVRAVSASCLIAVIICLGQSPMHFPRLAGTIIPLFAFLVILKRKEGVPLK
jgi:hypothetical protein